jgi:hypothetical protein
MKNRNYLKLILVILFVSANSNLAFGQSYCDAAGDAVAANTLLPWVFLPETKTGNWAASMKPVAKEMQRLFPQPPKGLEVTNGIAVLMDLNSATPNDIQYYEDFFMIKDIVCLKYRGKNEIAPEIATGNWIKFRVNDFKEFAETANIGALVLAGTQLRLNFSSDIRIEENKNGIKSIYFFNENNEQTFEGWYFSEIKALPYRRITKFEFAQSYRQYWLYKTNEEITRLEGVLETSKKTFARVSAEKGKSEAEKQKFFQSLHEGDKKTQQYIDQFKAKREDAVRFTDTILKSPEAKSEAYIINFHEILNQPSEIRFGDGKGKGKYVYVANQDFYNPKLPKWQPQLVVVQLRKEGDSPAKVGFVKKFEDEFDFNVIRKMVGIKPMPKSPTISTMGDTPDGITSGKIENINLNEASGEMFSENFSNAAIGQAPPKWTVSNNTGIVKNNKGAEGNWLAMSKEGLFFSDYSVLVLPTTFNLEFDVSWTKDISYYSPSFYFHLGAAPYDNTLKRYDRRLVNLNSYTSSKMERVALWIDPHWNSEQSHYGLQVFDNRGGYILNKSDKTKMFYRNKNRVKVKLVRNGSMLTIYFNGTKMMEEAVLSENIRWNFFGFGVNNAPNAEQGDEFYVSNIRLTKQ